MFTSILPSIWGKNYTHTHTYATYLCIFVRLRLRFCSKIHLHVAIQLSHTHTTVHTIASSPPFTMYEHSTRGVFYALWPPTSQHIKYVLGLAGCLAIVISCSVGGIFFLLLLLALVVCINWITFVKIVIVWTFPITINDTKLLFNQKSTATSTFPIGKTVPVNIRGTQLLSPTRNKFTFFYHCEVA